MLNQLRLRLMPWGLVHWIARLVQTQDLIPDRDERQARLIVSVKDYLRGGCELPYNIYETRRTVA